MRRLKSSIRTALELMLSSPARAELRFWLKHRNCKPRPLVPPADGKVRLNLGCGDKLMKGFVNVDVSRTRKNVTPDLIADLRYLNLRSDSVDEILGVHVIEHFYYWEVEKLLAEWCRVLKPGGRVVLECPNLFHAVRLLYRNPEYANYAYKRGQMTTWVLYGDPSWQDPLMCHRWGYTPESLARLLRRAGFSAPKRELPVFKQRHPRDMRITAIKPDQGNKV